MILDIYVSGHLHQSFILFIAVVALLVLLALVAAAAAVVDLRHDGFKSRKRKGVWVDLDVAPFCLVVP